MHSLFNIAPSDIERLNDEQARELVARLCKAELHSQGLGTAPVAWGGDQRAADGGVDVRVTLPAPPIQGSYIPRAATVYQVKAEKFAPAKIPGEMAPHGELRAALTELGQLGGAYIIVSTRDKCSETTLNKRLAAMSQCLDEHGFPNAVLVDFYDTRKIADWVENHPGIVIWLRGLLNRPLQGWKPYGPWAYRQESVSDTYLLDDKVKVVLDTDEALPALGAINRLRSQLLQAGTSVRIVGLSGVGKTRLVQALFDERINTSAAHLNSENVIYTDVSDDPDPLPLTMLESLLVAGADCVVVVDNCGQSTHSKLTEIVKQASSRLRLITVEYDIRDDLPSDTASYRLEGSSNEIISALLEHRYSTLSALDINKIVEFSDGNARVAFALASTSEGKGQLARLRDDALFRRLFFQKNSENDELERCAEAASLLYSFDFVDVEEASELNLLASIAQVSVPIFQRHISELKRRGLVQERGQWRAVLPHAIANRLAMRCIEMIPPQTIVKKLVTDAQLRGARSFSRRLGYLHESRAAQAIAMELFAPDGLLYDVSKLEGLEIQILENVAPLVQRETLEKLSLATLQPEFVSVSKTNRRRIGHSRLLRALAYEADLFDEAALALHRFALVEDENYHNNSARDLLKSLFYIHLSGTLAPPEQRAAFISSMICSDAGQQKLSVSLLQAALQAGSITSHYGFEFGARKRTYGWHPTTQEGIECWYETFLRLAGRAANTNSKLGRDIRALIGNALRNLWGTKRINDIFIQMAHELVAIDGWPDGWLGARSAMRWNKDQYDSSSIEQLKIFEQLLAPNDLWGNIQVKVLSRGALVSVDFEDDQVGEARGTNTYMRLRDESKQLGKDAAVDESVLADIAPYLYDAGDSDNPFYFATGVAEQCTSILPLLFRSREAILARPGEPYDFQFVCGLLAGRQPSHPEEVATFLDGAVTDEIWGKKFPRLQMAIELDEAACQRLIRSLSLSIASSWEFGSLCHGRKTDSLSIPQINMLITAISKRRDNGPKVAIDVLRMVATYATQRDDAYNRELQLFLADYMLHLDWSRLDLNNQHMHIELGDILQATIARGDPHAVTKSILKDLVGYASIMRRFISPQLGRVIMPFAKERPIETLDIVFAGKDEDWTYHLLTVDFGRDGNSALSVISPKIWLEWCSAAETKERHLFAARQCRLFETIENNGMDEKQLSLSLSARAILGSAPDKHEVLNIFLQRFNPRQWTGSRAVEMRRYLPLFDQARQDNNPALNACVDAARVRFETMILTEQKYEIKQQEGYVKSFE